MGLRALLLRPLLLTWIGLLGAIRMGNSAQLEAGWPAVQSTG